jgi:uncharacterized protein with HEPN domain
MQRDEAYLVDMLIAGMRNRLIHEYFRIHLPTLWQTVQDDVPPLIAQLEPLAPPDAP